MHGTSRLIHLTATAGLLALLQGAALPAAAYDGTNCKRHGDCWEPKPGYPAKIAGSKYDPRHDQIELDKQAKSIKDMEARNAKRLEAFARTGTFKFDVE